MKDIYVIAIVKRLHNNLIPIGWEETIEAAKEVVETGRCTNLWGKPEFIVIEEISQGVPPLIKSQLWYRLIYNENKYERCNGCQRSGVFGSNVADLEQGVH